MASTHFTRLRRSRIHCRGRKCPLGSRKPSKHSTSMCATLSFLVSKKISEYHASMEATSSARSGMCSCSSYYATRNRPTSNTSMNWMSGSRKPTSKCSRQSKRQCSKKFLRRGKLKNGSINTPHYGGYFLLLLTAVELHEAVEVP